MALFTLIELMRVMVKVWVKLLAKTKLLLEEKEAGVVVMLTRFCVPVFVT
jgi:hypothetical protein